MFNAVDKTKQDAHAVESFQPAQISGERGSAELDTQRPLSLPGARLLFIIIIICATTIGLLFMRQASQLRSPPSKQPMQQTVSLQNPLPPLQSKALPTQKETPLEPPLPPLPQVSPTLDNESPSAQPPPQMQLRERRLRAGLTDMPQPAPPSDKPDQLTDPAHLKTGNSNELSSKLEPVMLSPATAGRFSDLNFLLTQGTIINCVLTTKIISSQPGMTVCNLTQDIYSANGQVVLLDRGSKVVGFYQSGIAQGQARIFVQWSRVETPQGVIINLASPGAGPLGEAGLSGWVDQHFGERFGGTIMLSLIGDLGEWAQAQSRREKTNSIQFGNSLQGLEQAATEALRNSINIAPTLYKNQGERISILVARDLDFSSVYGLQHPAQ
ncbi:type IV secretion system protein VirB10 [Mycoavidus sp. B2-EB]|uniref:type IV secretion system protein VirB10 n=1 Tax=Mycoavidus sp. B2-EB TaxID=2651972 RepID=UPI0016248614|nr:type IV secretion system protein VirB10 [Mycoavidus sp. B2-EB]BBO60330.1 channel protein VirB10 [Mycoavidus sp. B2-EB]